MYKNQALVGEGLRECLGSGRRGELFITSKIWNDEHRPDALRRALCGLLIILAVVVHAALFRVVWQPTRSHLGMRVFMPSLAVRAFMLLFHFPLPCVFLLGKRQCYALHSLTLCKLLGLEVAKCVMRKSMCIEVALKPC